jgi:cyclophilin family peptidyl-prolyl cis-trans isomerase
MNLRSIWKQVFILTAAAASQAAGAADPQVDLKTNHGTIRLELYPTKAPKTVENFLQYVKEGHYDGTVFHRVIETFMIQGGGFDAGMKQKPTRATIPNEAKNGLKNEVGTVAMARTSAPHSASAQFFINTKANGFLNAEEAQDGWGYAVFGKVVSGMDVVTKIAKVQTGNSGMHQNVPREPVVIESATLVEAKK